ncbi:hypothetical protein TCAL_00075 [Tigriopus californicus]|uniref:Uncharacterized protein n=1 Tax=Tigriopus californicus TaxID=6832 RepID=A0A553PFQ1_TIGCA|nr:hypothetical protein TCAL_00075 [Tigriopus californicus]|eukprot:TCALIF_00075-PA protein Name:"Protein of unknown function" AED:0.46 eAED:1.00 QI:0/0/0/1/1/0.5/2/0/137
MSKKRTHPGCSIFWFLKDCPLGEIFGVDPFKMYPWEKFCTQYTGFKGIKQCRPFEKTETKVEEKEVPGKKSATAKVKPAKVNNKQPKESTPVREPKTSDNLNHNSNNDYSNENPFDQIILDARFSGSSPDVRWAHLE